VFSAPAEAYDAFMGGYSRLLAPRFAAFAGIAAGQRVVDVGCGPGALTEVLAGLVGPESVAAADPSPGFVAACASRVPDADVRAAPAEALPWDDGAFDASLAQLVFAFVGDPSAGLAEMTRVVQTGGVVATCMWELDAMAMLRTFWDAASMFDTAAPAEGSRTRFANRGELEQLWRSGRLDEVVVEAIDVEREYPDFESYWRPFLAGIGPAGSYCAALDPDARDAVREECRRRLGAAERGFTLAARAWAVRGRVPR
jgi:ubiquinone/menaquinone biosynthesis C-methylase UbiE